MAVRNILILTSSFPYAGGEQFIETEIKFWAQSEFNNVCILPNSFKGNLRPIPDQIKVVGNTTNEKYKFIYIIKALFSVFFIKELKVLFKNKKNKFSFINFWAALVTCANIIRQKEKINAVINDFKGEILVYSYWNDVTAYAACLLKREGKVAQVISRAHGADLYKERRKNHYMPIKWQFVNDHDAIFLLSLAALKYYRVNYGASNNILNISRLGVEVPNSSPSYFFNKKVLKVLSISYCVEVKRIDKMIDALTAYAKDHPVSIEWTHIGGGELFESLKAKAEKNANDVSTFNYNFMGHIDNTDIKQILETGSFDIFINSSESEGIPVSIMEAMSSGIPAIAPDIGGISDLVQHKNNGYLISSQANIDEIVEGLEYLHQETIMNTYRTAAKEWILKEFNAKNNYSEFIQQINTLVANKNEME